MFKIAQLVFMFLFHLISAHSVNHSGSACVVIGGNGRAPFPETSCSLPCHFLAKFASPQEEGRKDVGGPQILHHHYQKFLLFPAQSISASSVCP
jgi:hypothetical protein